MRTPDVLLLNYGVTAKNNEYRGLVLKGVNVPEEINIGGLRGKNTSMEILWNMVSKASLVIGSGSVLNVGDYKKGSIDLVPNEEIDQIEILTDVFRFMILEEMRGNDDIREIHALFNCFSAQTLAFAITLAAFMKKQKMNTSLIHDPSDFSRKYPIAELVRDKKYRFPIVEASATQLGMIPTERLADEWPFHDLPTDDFFYVHTQAIDMEILMEAARLLNGMVKILAKRKKKINRRGETETINIVDIFQWGANKWGTQPHLDYGKPANLLAVLERLDAMGKDWRKLFKPGPGGEHHDGRPRSEGALKSHLGQAVEVCGPKVLQRLVDAAHRKILLRKKVTQEKIDAALAS